MFNYIGTNEEPIEIPTERPHDNMENNEPIWVSVKELFKLLKEMDMWTMDAKYLHIYLDTRFIDGDYHCTIKDRENKRYLSLDDIKEMRKSVNS